MRERRLKVVTEGVLPGSRRTTSPTDDEPVTDAAIYLCETCLVILDRHWCPIFGALDQA